MKTLLITFLMAVLALQGAVTVVGFNSAAGVQESVQHRCDAGPAACELEQLSGSTDLSPAVEELSDYLPIALSPDDGYRRLEVAGQRAARVLSIILPTHKPPPRA